MEMDMNELDLAREVQTLRARRRLSTSHPAAIDPDFAGVQLYDKSPSVHDLQDNGYERK